MSILHSPDRRPLWLLVWALALPAAAAPSGDTAAAQFERLARERARVEAESRVAQAACAQQFAVTACVDGVKAERRQRLQVLDRERAVLDDAARKRRAAERLALIERREAMSAQRQPALTVRTRAPAGASSSALASAPARVLPASAPSSAAAASQADAQAAARAAGAAQREAQAVAHRSAVEKRNRERAKQRPPAAPLPLPSAASR